MSAPLPDSWAAWGRVWRGGPAPALPSLADLQRREARHRSRRLAMLVIEAVVALSALGMAGWLLRGGRDLYATLWAADAVLITGVTVAFTTWNRRGTWRPAAQTLEAHLALGILRCRRRLVTVVFALAVVAVQAAGVAAVVALGLARPAAGSRLVLPAAVVLGYAAWAAWYARHTRRELAWLEDLRGGEPPGL